MSERAELTAVATRRKALSYEGTPLPLVAPRLPALLRVAASSDLAVVIMARLFAYLPPQRAPQLDRAEITEAQTRELAEGMRTNVEFLTRRGWQ